jgi:hypothetical protein
MRPDEIAGDDFRAAIGAMDLRSTQFTLKKTSSGFRFTGKGFGHGVGMCVIGAGRLAARGATAAEILSLYYPGLALTREMKGFDAGDRVFNRSSRSVPESTSIASVVNVPEPSPLPAGAALVAVHTTAAAGDRRAIERLALAVHAELTQTIGSTVAPIVVKVHPSIESFRYATGRPWWVSAVVSGTVIDLAPEPILVQREGIEGALRVAMAEALIGDTFSGRPAWIRVGAARYFARGGRSPSPVLGAKAKCPTDADVTMGISAPAQREAEMRAEACFARALAKARDWRQVR